GFKYGRAVGAIDAVVACCEIPMTVIEPSAWIEYLLRKLLQWRNASSTRLRYSALAFVPALQPLYRRTHAHLETLSRLAPRRTAFNSFDYAFPQITRIGLRHRPPPQRRINARRFVHPYPFGNPADSNRAGTALVVHETAAVAGRAGGFAAASA